MALLLSSAYISDPVHWRIHLRLLSLSVDLSMFFLKFNISQTNFLPAGIFCLTVLVGDYLSSSCLLFCFWCELCWCRCSCIVQTLPVVNACLIVQLALGWLSVRLNRVSERMWKIHCFHMTCCARLIR